MNILGVYILNISLNDNAEIVEQIFLCCDPIDRNVKLGIDFITENALVLDGETRRATYKTCFQSNNQ
jgi:hypothetical protein